jgi:hypothetical protein
MKTEPHEIHETDAALRVAIVCALITVLLLSTLIVAGSV